jgi:hypothetical protein
MKKSAYPLICVSLLFVVGCTTESRSISNSGYYGGWGNYRGELSELDILGTAPAQEATDATIRGVLASATDPKIKRGDKLLLIQSGAMVPDNEMMEAAGACFSVAPFAGVPPAEKSGTAGSLRLRAAQGGYRYILCYWGVLETAQQDKEGKAVSWIPVVGSIVPDQKEQMRMRLRAILVDVSTGNWKMLTPEIPGEALFSSRKTRMEEDQKLVRELKAKGYKKLVEELLRD